MAIMIFIGILASIAIPPIKSMLLASEAVIVGTAVKTIVTQSIVDNGGNIPVNACFRFKDISTATNNVVSIEC